MKTQFSPHMLSRVALALVAFGLGAQAQAQISSINSAVVTPRFFNDMTSATGTYINNYPTAITLGESGAWRATSGGLDRDLWQFSNNNGSSAYTFGANDHFTATITLRACFKNGLIRFCPGA